MRLIRSHSFVDAVFLFDALPTVLISFNGLGDKVLEAFPVLITDETLKGP